MILDSFHSKVAGVTYNNEDGDSRQKIIKKYCKAGDELELIREPDNEHSPTAIGVWLKKPSLKIGYVRSASDLSKRLSEHLNRGRTIRCKVSNVTGGQDDKETLGVNMFVEVIGAPQEAKRGLFAKLLTWSKWVLISIVLIPIAVFCFFFVQAMAQ